MNFLNKLMSHFFKINIEQDLLASSNPKSLNL